MIFRALCGLLLSAAAPFVGAQESPNPAAHTPIKVTFGTYAFRKPTEVFKQFQPVTVELSRLLTAQLGETATVELIVVKTYEECLDQFVKGKIDVVRLGPASYVLAKERNPKVEILAAENEDSRNVGLIVVREDSPFQKLSDLAGKRFAFGDDQSTIGRFLSQAELVRAGVHANDLAQWKYLERHDIVFKAVEIGDYDAGALHADTFKELNEKASTKLRVLHPFDNVRKPWIARAELEPRIANAFRASLLALKDAPALKALKVPGFVAATDSDYELVRKGMQDVARFAPQKEDAPAAEPAPKPAPAKE